MKRIKEFYSRVKEFFVSLYGRFAESGAMTAVFLVFAVLAFLMLIWSARQHKPDAPRPVSSNSHTEEGEPKGSGIGFSIRLSAGTRPAEAATAPLPPKTPAINPEPVVERRPGVVYDIPPVVNTRIGFVLLMAGDRAVLYEAARGDVTFKDGSVEYTSTEGRKRRFLGNALYSETPLPFNGATLVRSATGRIFKVD